MTRIIAGAAKGLVLGVPSKGTRPTSDRVRESVFSILEHEDIIPQARVLDLFAGSGALGFEALSRGAASADLVDLSSAAVQVLRKNAEQLTTRLKDVRTTVYQKKAKSFLELVDPSVTWDLVFCDPPYDIAPRYIGEVLTLLAKALAPDGMVVLEQASRQKFDISTDLYEEILQRRYGDTTISLLIHRAKD